MNLTANDLITRFGEQEIAEVSDHENRREIDYQVVNKAIADAESEARSYYNAAGLVGVSFDNATISKIADIAIYELWENGASEERIRRYERAIKWFEYLVEHPNMIERDDGKGKAYVGRAKLVRG